MSVSGVSLLGVTQDEAADAIRNSGENVTMVIARNPYPEDDQVHFGFFRSIYYYKKAAHIDFAAPDFYMCHL